jgi:hypothetical protein
MDARFYTTKQVALILQVGQAAIRRAVARGDVPAKRLSPRGPLRIPESFLLEPDLPTTADEDEGGEQ